MMKVYPWLALSCLLVVGCDGSLGGNLGDGNLDGGLGAGAGSGLPGSGGGASTDNGTVELPGGLKVDGMPVYFRVVRLAHTQWENSVRDVLLLPEVTGLSTGFIPDPPDGKFSNNERALYLTDTLRADYQRSAETVAETVASDPAALGQLGADAASVIANVGRRAFRRPLTTEEQAAFQALWDSGAGFFESGDAFADGAQIFIEAVLQSPHFLFRVEVSPPDTRLSGLELATRLSFLLRGTTPSEELLTQAMAGALDTDEGLRTVVSAMLAEPGASGSLLDFHSQLFGLDRYRSIAKNSERFPTYTDGMNQVLYDADRAFFARIYDQGFGFREILTSNVAYANDDLAPFYGIESPGPALTEVTLDASRPGYLTRIGFLAYNGTLNDPDPIHRGVDINNKILCAELEPPPGEIPALPPFQADQTNRERVAAHTEVGACKGCHGSVINPPGFSLENFDAMGQIRTMDNGKPVDTSGVFGNLEGEPAFTGITDLATVIAENPVAHSCYSLHLAEYAFARDMGSTEQDLVTAVQGASQTANAPLPTLLLSILTSPAFTTARTPTP